jgi:hypothetical protein
MSVHSLSNDPTDHLTAEQVAFIDGLRELADFLERAPRPERLIDRRDAVRLIDYQLSRSLLVERERELGGPWEKGRLGTDDTYFYLTRRFGPHEVTLYTDRSNVCERVVITETVTREVPDPDAPPVPMVTVTEEVERVSWRCPESLLEPLPVDVDFLAGSDGPDPAEAGF